MFSKLFIAGMSPELYNHPKGSLFEIRVREIIYQLNNSKYILDNNYQFW